MLAVLVQNLPLASETEFLFASFDEKRFNETKTKYGEYLSKQMIADGEAQLIEDIKDESHFEIYEIKTPAEKKQQ